jgi:hypothetical protein
MRRLGGFADEGDTAEPSLYDDVTEPSLYDDVFLGFCSPTDSLWWYASWRSGSRWNVQYCSSLAREEGFSSDTTFWEKL